MDEPVLEFDDTFLDFGVEVAHETLDGPHSGAAEGADRSDFDLVSVCAR